MKIEEIKIIDNKLILPKRLLRILMWKYPFHRIPDLNEYNQRIIDFSKENNQLPFYSKFDINNDGKEELMLIQKSIIGGFGRLLIISINNGKYKIEKVKWRRPVNALFFDYLIDIAEPRKYQKFGLRALKEGETQSDFKKPQRVIVNYPHLITKGYITRIVYWDDFKFNQEKISDFHTSDES